MCEQLQHLDIKNDVCIYSKCVKCHKNIFNIDDFEDEENNYKKISNKLSENLNKVNRTRNRSKNRSS